MSGTEPTQAAGGDGHKGENVGIAHPGGKHGGGESEGGAYPDPEAGKEPGENGFTGHGGQSHINYSGTGAQGDDDAVNVNDAAGTRPGS